MFDSLKKEPRFTGTFTVESTNICSQAELNSLLSACPEASVIVTKLIDTINTISIDSRQAKEEVVTLKDEIVALKDEIKTLKMIVDNNKSNITDCNTFIGDLRRTDQSLADAIEELQKRID